MDKQHSSRRFFNWKEWTLVVASLPVGIAAGIWYCLGFIRSGEAEIPSVLMSILIATIFSGVFIVAFIAGYGVCVAIDQRFSPRRHRPSGW